MTTISTAEWIGYGASAVIAVSLLITNVWYFRWINMAGAFLFCLYGLLIQSIPVAFMNGLIGFIDLYFIVQMIIRVDYFHYLDVKYRDNSYLQYFLKYYVRDIGYHFPRFAPEQCPPDQKYTIILRNAIPVGVFSYHKEGESGIIDLDYIIPEYRDLKNTRLLIRDGLAGEFKDRNIRRLTVETAVPKYIKYIKALGFEEDPERDNTYHLPLPFKED